MEMLSPTTKTDGSVSVEVIFSVRVESQAASVAISTSTANHLIFVVIVFALNVLEFIFGHLNLIGVREFFEAGVEVFRLGAGR
jgi:hypothetical protein